MNAKDYEVKKLLQAGYSYTEIASQLNVGNGRISKISKALRNSDNKDIHTTTTTTTTPFSKLPINPKKIIQKDEVEHLWSIYATLARRRSLSIERMDKFLSIIRKLEVNYL